jgi:hypothetical protein
MDIMLRLSPGRGARVDHFLTDRLDDQVAAARVLDALAPVLDRLSNAVKNAYARVHRNRKNPSRDGAV